MDPFHTGDEFESTRNINLALGRSHIASVAEESRAMVWPYNLSYSETGTAKPNVGKMAFSLFVNSRDRGVGVVTNQLTELFKARGVSPDGPFVDDEDYGESPVTYRTRDPKGGWLCVERLKDDPLSGPVIRVVGAGEDALAAARVAAGRCTSSCLLEHQECSGTRALPQVGGIDGLAVTWVMGAEAPGYVPGEPEPGRQGLFGVSVLFEMSLPAAAEADKEFLKEGVSPNVVGRGLVSFIDGSWSPAVGPTIEKLSIRKDYRGRGLIMNLYREMERWVLDHWTLDALDGKLHFKATQLTGSVIDETPTGNPISDTTLLYKMCGWAANTGSCGGIAGLLSSGRPSDEEAIRRYRPGEEVGSSRLIRRGRFACEHCKSVERRSHQYQRCSRCKQVRYCGRECQRLNWPRHKLWCSKTYEQVQAEVGLGGPPVADPNKK